MNECEEPLVSICSITYNHAPYIRKCIEGFLMQKATFAYEIIIHDDCSTDGTMEILKEYEAKYPQKINVIYEVENQYSKGVRGLFEKYVFPLAKGKYIALCEGDDFWTDSLKLQKQISFLENHPDYSMCFHNAFVIKAVSNLQSIYAFTKFDSDCDFTLEDAIRKWQIPTASLVFRREDSLDYPAWMAKIYSGDWSLSIVLLLRGRGRFLNDFMSVYNLKLNGNSVSAITSRNSIFMYEEHKKLVNSLYNIPNITDSLRKVIDKKIIMLDSLISYESIKMEKKWWMLLMKKTNFQLFVNNIKRAMLNRILIYLNS